MPLSKKDLDLLRDKYQWPNVPPDFSPAEWVLDGGGKNLITDRISKNEDFLIIEVGVFLGSSVKKWLAVSPRVNVIAIDPWEGDWWAEYALKHGRRELVEQFRRKDGPYMTFLSSLRGCRDRVFPVRGMSPNKLYELAELRVRPDLIYFDNDKTGDDIEVAHRLFPSAILAGDDWTWGVEKGFPIRKAVRRFAQEHGYFVRSNRSTWIVDQNGYSIVDHLNKGIQLAKDQVLILRSFLKRLMK
jgi:hypothetical protein